MRMRQNLLPTIASTSFLYISLFLFLSFSLLPVSFAAFLSILALRLLMNAASEKMIKLRCVAGICECYLCMHVCVCGCEGSRKQWL